MIAELAAIGAAEGPGYNVHLPTDVSLADPDPIGRRRAVDAPRRACDHAAPCGRRPSPCTSPAGRRPPVDPWRRAGAAGPSPSSRPRWGTRRALRSKPWTTPRSGSAS
ncbi:MAG: hypothetical protein MZV70_46715 [Desulfobacterales bacterium]|nr:hypothetical protein [Desulfobacterales bacterium]